MQYHRGLSSIRKWELSLRVLQVCPSLAEKCPEGSADHLIHTFTLRHLFMHCTEISTELYFVSHFIPDLPQAQNTEQEVHFLSLLDSQLFVHYSCRQAGAWVGSFWPYFSSGHSLQLCFSFLWLELIIAASPLQREGEKSWRYLSVVIENKMRKHGKEDRIGFRGQWMLSE